MHAHILTERKTGKLVNEGLHVESRGRWYFEIDPHYTSECDTGYTSLEMCSMMYSMVYSSFLLCLFETAVWLIPVIRAATRQAVDGTGRMTWPQQIRHMGALPPPQYIELFGHMQLEAYVARAPTPG